MRGEGGEREDESVHLLQENQAVVAQTERESECRDSRE